jgi:hypothetical protein
MAGDDGKGKGSEIFKKIIGFLRDLVSKTVKFILTNIFKVLGIHIVVVITYIVTVFVYKTNGLVNTCYDADTFIARTNYAEAYHNIGGEDPPYNHENFSQILGEQEKKVGNTVFKLNGTPLKIRIWGKWSPWYGKLTEGEGRESTLGKAREDFFCAMEKVNLPYSKRFSYVSEREGENVFYYIKNYYKSVERVVRQDENGNVSIVMEAKEEPPERQEACWITRGHGLYLGASGFDGNKSSTEFHHVLGDKMVCPNIYWFGGTSKKDTDKIVNEDNYVYTYEDFKRNYFSVDYYISEYGGLLTPTELEKAKRIFTTDGSGAVIFDISLYEDFLYKINSEVAALRIPESMRAFALACYVEKKEKATGKMIRTTSQHYFSYGPTILKRHLSN